MHVASAPDAARPQTPARQRPALLWLNTQQLAAFGSQRSPDEQRILDQRRDDDHERHSREDAAADAQAAPTTADTIRQGERDLAPNSRAFRQSAQRDAAMRATQNRGDQFRDALRSASHSVADAEKTQSGAPQLDSKAPTGARSPASTSAESRDVAATTTSKIENPQLRQPGSAPVKMPTTIDPTPSTKTTTPSVAHANAIPASAQPPITPTVAPLPNVSANPTPASIATTPSAPSIEAVAEPKAASTAGAPEGIGVGQTARRGPLDRTQAAPKAAAEPRDAELEQSEFRANVERLMRVVRREIREGGSSTVVRLNPPELGMLRLQMDLRGDALTLQVQTDTPLAHHLLSREIKTLRDGLDAAGVTLERVEIRPPGATAAPEPQNAGGDPQTGWSGAQAQQRDANRDDAGTRWFETPRLDASREDETETSSAAETRVNVLA